MCDVTTVPSDVEKKLAIPMKWHMKFSGMGTALIALIFSLPIFRPLRARLGPTKRHLCHLQSELVRGKTESGRGRCVESLDKALYSHCPKEEPSH